MATLSVVAAAAACALLSMSMPLLDGIWVFGTRIENRDMGLCCLNVSSGEY